MVLYVGTSGWQYKHWRDTFYPRSVPQSRWLPYYAERFQCVEVNNSFYMLPKTESFAKWAAETPDDFVIALKFSRYLTHIRRLAEPEDSIRRFFERAPALGAKIGPILLQLPPTLRPDIEALDRTLEVMPEGVRVAVEFRHRDWFTEATYDVMRAHDAAMCLADRKSRPISAIVPTASWGYVRFHHGLAAPQPCYGPTALRSWAERIDQLWGPEADVYAFFNNDPRACALRDATRFAAVAARIGLQPTRVPAPGDVTLG